MIYFDNSATTFIHESVLSTLQTVQKEYAGNPSSLHDLGTKAAALLQKARHQVAELLGCANDEVFFTSGGTECNNTAILGTAFEKQQYGKHVITTQIEHPSVRRSCEFLEQLGFDVTYLPVDKQGVVSVDSLKEAMREDTILVSTMWVNNEVGTIAPIDAIAQVLEAYPSVHFHVDAVQAVDFVLTKGIHPRVDLLSLSSHKFHGPRGTGILYKKNNRKIKPLLHGGGQEKQLRSGTENTAGIVATAKALRLYGEQQVLLSVYRDVLMTYLQAFEKVTVFSNEQGVDHILTFAIRGIRGEVLVHALEKEHVYVSTTSACSSKVKSTHHTLGAMGVPSQLSQCAVRLSLSKWSTMAEIEQFKLIFDTIYANFDGISG